MRSVTVVLLTFISLAPISILALPTGGREARHDVQRQAATKISGHDLLPSSERAGHQPISGSCIEIIDSASAKNRGECAEKSGLGASRDHKYLSSKPSATGPAGTQARAEVNLSKLAGIRPMHPAGLMRRMPARPKLRIDTNVGSNNGIVTPNMPQLPTSPRPPKPLPPIHLEPPMPPSPSNLPTSPRPPQPLPPIHV